jgi:hypothetical protein
VFSIGSKAGSEHKKEKRFPANGERLRVGLKDKRRPDTIWTTVAESTKNAFRDFLGARLRFSGPGSRAITHDRKEKIHHRGHQVIKAIKLKFGRAPGAAAEIINPTPITIFVGPNNSGKSKVLSEIHEFCVRGLSNTADVILDDIEFLNATAEHAEEEVKRIELEPRPADSLQPGFTVVGWYGTRVPVNRETLVRSLQNTAAEKNFFCYAYLRFKTLTLSGQNRIAVLNEQAAGDLHHPTNNLQILFSNDVKRRELRRIIHDTFGSYLVIDPTNMGRLRVRLSPREPVDDREERGWHEEAVKFHAAALPIEATSDGVKAFTGIITEIIAGDPEVIMIDEPEAFLHPALSFNLGKEIGRATTGSEKRVFVSTHSADFLMGCIQSGASLTIVRLTYQDGTATARILPSEDILRLMRNPLLRSTGVLNGLFYKFVIVTEGDADRAFYQEINHRLLRFKPEWGIPNCLFLQAQNKQTIQKIIRPLRDMGIPAAGVVDIDVLKEGSSPWKNFLEGGFIPKLERDPLGQMRGQIMRKFVESGKDMNEYGGIEILSPDDKEAANNLFDSIANYGLFVVRRGELESWLPQLGVKGHAPDWLITMFEKMGEDPESESYLKPSDSDVWRFIADIKRWLTNPDRRGIPQ